MIFKLHIQTFNFCHIYHTVHSSSRDKQIASAWGSVCSTEPGLTDRITGRKSTKIYIKVHHSRVTNEFEVISGKGWKSSCHKSSELLTYIWEIYERGSFLCVSGCMSEESLKGKHAAVLTHSLSCKLWTVSHISIIVHNPLMQQSRIVWRTHKSDIKSKYRGFGAQVA